jgi:hypothetical protein
VLPPTLDVKMSSEAAEYVALTPVVTSEMALAELLELVVDAVGLDAGRVAEILKRGSLVSGATRFRWAALGATPDDLHAALARLPRPEPARPLDAALCTEVVLVGRAGRTPISAAAGRKRRLFKRRSFWDELFASVADVRYMDYGYRAHADRYTASLKGATWFGAAVELLSFSVLRRHLAAAPPERVEFSVSRRAGS